MDGLFCSFKWDSSLKVLSGLQSQIGFRCCGGVSCGSRSIRRLRADPCRSCDVALRDYSVLAAMG